MGLDNRVSIKKYDTQKEEVTTMGAPVNRVGEIYGSLKIIEELGGNRIICKCIIHESINEYDKKQSSKRTDTLQTLRYTEKTGKKRLTLYTLYTLYRIYTKDI